MLPKKLCIFFCIFILAVSSAYAACPNTSTSKPCSSPGTCSNLGACDKNGVCSTGTCKPVTTKAAVSSTTCKADFIPTVSGGKLIFKNNCVGTYTACYWKIVDPKGKVTISRDCNPSLSIVKGRWYAYFNPKFTTCGWSKDIAKRFTVA